MTESTNARNMTNDLRYRIWNEFREMPGMRITLPQACRLWTVDPATGERVLRELVDAAILRRIGQYYMRADLDRFSA